MKTLTITTNVRPGRSVVFVDQQDDHWQSTCLRILEYFSRTWGGCGNIIIPTDGNSISPCFWRLLEVFDPDYLHVYKRSGRDMELEEPDRFQKFVDEQVRSWEKQIGDTAHDAAVKHIRERLQHGILKDFQIAAGLQSELKLRLAPFFFQKWIVDAGAITAGTRPRHPDTDIVEILPCILHSPTVLHVGENSKVLGELWCASLFGRQDSALQTEFAKLGITAREFAADEAGLKKLIHLGAVGRDDPRDAAFWADESLEEIQSWVEAFPSQFSIAGLSRYRSLSYHDWQEPAVAVAGTTVADFCFYYALSRMRERVLWVLPSITECALNDPKREPKVDHEFHFATVLRNLARGDSHHYGGLKFVSISLTSEQLGSVKERIETVGFEQLSQCESVAATSTIPAYPLRYFEANNAYRPRSISVPDDGVIPLFETPTPKNFTRVEPSKHRWITELGILRYHLPRHASLAWWMMGSAATTTNEVRVSSVGPSYFCPHILISGGNDIETSVIRPSISIPEPLQLFEVIARSASLRCMISDKGFYAAESCKKFGGLEEICQFLRSPEGKAVRLAFLDKSKSQPGDHSKGFLLSDRRYLDYRAFEAAIGHVGSAAEIIERLSQRGVLYRGFVLQCQYCKRTDWFPVAAVTDSFTCTRCHREQIYTRAHWMNPEQPQWYHQLDEIVYQGLTHDMDVPLLTLDFLRRESNNELIAAPELSYWAAGEAKPVIECDINCVVDGVLTVGEAKSTDRLGNSAKEELAAIDVYKKLAKALGARQLIFATSAEHWRDKTAETIAKAFEGDYLTVRLLNHTLLYT